MSIRREALYLRDIMEATASIDRFLEGIDREQFIESDLLQSAVLQKLTVIGESAANIPKALCVKYPAIPWGQIVGFRNIAVHAYFSVDWSIVWTAATEDAPLLARQVGETIAAEFPDLRT